MSTRTDLGGNEHPSARYRADTPRDFDLPNDDRELAALIFGGLCAAPLIVLSIVLFYLAS